MGILLKEMLDVATLKMLTSNSEPDMIRQSEMIDATKQFVKTIKKLELYPIHQELIDRFESLRENYPSLYTHRTLYLWQMSQAVFELTSLNLVDTDFLQANSLKCQSGVLTVILDDICDIGDDTAVFHKAVLALKGQIDTDKIELYQFIADTWSAFQNAIAQTPNYALLTSALEDAYQRWIASFEYTIWLRESSRLEEQWERHLEIISHSMTLYLAGLIDLLFIPNLSASQVSLAKEVFLRTQKMAEVGNWATTWERELAQQDFTSGVFTIALQNHWIDWDDLKNGSQEKVRQQIRNSPVESYLWREWERLRVESHQLVKETQLPALNGYVDSFSAIMFMELASTGQH